MWFMYSQGNNAKAKNNIIERHYLNDNFIFILQPPSFSDAITQSVCLYEVPIIISGQKMISDFIFWKNIEKKCTALRNSNVLQATLKQNANLHNGIYIFSFAIYLFVISFVIAKDQRQSISSNTSTCIKVNTVPNVSLWLNQEHCQIIKKKNTKVRKTVKKKKRE